jgi:NTE family protein
VVNPVPISLARAMGAEVVIAVNLNTDMHQPWTDEPDEPVQGAAQPVVEPGRARTQYPRHVGGDDGLHQHHAGASPVPGWPGIPEIQLCPRLGNLSIMDFHRASDAINEGKPVSSATWSSSRRSCHDSA